MNPELVSGLLRHLEQSTVVVAAAWLLTVALRQNRAAIRYGIWFAASMKFLLPLDLLMGVGAKIAEKLQDSAGFVFRAADFPETIGKMSWPVSHAALLALPKAEVATHANVAPAAFAIWGCGAVFLLVRWGCKWRRIRRAVRSAAPYRVCGRVPIVCTRTLLEPGVCGVIQPVLLLPAAILDHLSEEQLQAIVAHEMCHVRRHDNLLYIFHLVVETLFWFHPLVWWLGRRLLEERERACDEATVLAGNDAAVYAQGILNICRCCLRSAPAWVAGISGADLKNRVTRIVRGDIGKRLSLSRIALLGAVGILVIAVPLGIGVVSGAQDAVGKASVARLHFEVATIKLGQPSPRESGFFIDGAVSM